MRSDFELGACPFCQLDRKFNKILFENDKALAWEIPDMFERKKGLASQLLIVPKRHVRFPWELLPDENTALYDAVKWLSANFDLPGGMLFCRFGDMRYNAGTVPHLHWNLWVPDGTKEIRVPIYKDPADRVANQERAASYALLYEADGEP